MKLREIFKINLADEDLWDDINGEVLLNLKGFLAQQQLYSAAIKEIRTKLEILDEEFQVHYDHNPIHNIEFRLKSPDSIIKKLKRKNLEISLDSIWNNIYDIAGVRVICNYIQDIYYIADLLTKQDDIKLLRVRDYIKNPKENGYRSLHLIVQVPVFLAKETKLVPVEVQIRTIAMDFWASLEHKLRYKAKENVPENLKKRLIDCAEQIAKLDSEMQAIYIESKKLNNVKKGK